MNRKTPFMVLSSMFVLIVFVLGCTADAGSLAATDMPTASPPPTQTAEPTEIAVSVEGFVPIDKDNFRDIELIAELGAGKLYDTVVSPDGSTFATVTASGVTLYNMETFEEINHYEDYIFPAAPLAYSPDGKYLVYTDHVKVYRIDIESWEMERLFFLPGQKSQVEALIFTPNGNRIFVGNLYTSYKCDGREIGYSLFTLDGNLLFSNNICKTYHNVFYQFNDDDTTLFGFSYTMTGAFPYDLFLIENETGNALSASHKRQYEYGGEVTKTIMGDESLLPTTEQLHVIYNEFYSFESEKLLLHCSVPYTLHPPYTTYFKYDPFVITHSTVSNSIAKVDRETCEIMQELHIPSADTLEFNATGELAVTTNEFSTYAWKMVDETPVFSDKGMLLQYPSNLAIFNHDGTYLLTGPYSNPSHHPQPKYSRSEVTVWDVETFEMISKIDFSGRTLHAFYDTPLANIMIIEDSSGSHLWNIESGEMISKLPEAQYFSDEVNQQLWVLQKISRYGSGHAPFLFDPRSGKLITAFHHIFGRNIKASLAEDTSTLEIQFQNQDGEFVKCEINSETSERIWNKAETNNATEKISEDEYGSDCSVQQSGWDTPVLIRDGYEFTSAEFLETEGPFIVTDDMKFWDKVGGTYMGELRTDYEINRVMFSPNEYFLALVGDDGIARIYGVRDE